MTGPKQQERAGGTPPARSTPEPSPAPDIGLAAAPEKPQEQRLREDREMISAGSRIQTQQAVEGVAVVGEAVRRVEPEIAEFLIEITASGATGAQAIHNHQTKTAQIAQAGATLGIQRADLQTVSLNIINAYGPLMQALPAYGVPQVGQGGYGAYGAPST